MAVLDGERLISTRTFKGGIHRRVRRPCRGGDGCRWRGCSRAPCGPRWTRLRSATLIDDSVIAYLKTTIDLAPLHQPPAIAGIEAARRAFPEAAQVACFRHRLHDTLTAAASTYALPKEWNERWGFDDTGFHGLSHAYAFRAGAHLADVPADSRAHSDGSLGCGRVAVRGTRRAFGRYNDGFHATGGASRWSRGRAVSIPA